MDAELEGRVLVVGVSAASNARLVAELEALGLEATSCVEAQDAAGVHDATGFDVIAFARATLGRTAYAQQRTFLLQNPQVRIVESVGPLAVRQIVGALRRDPRTPRFITALDVEPTPARGVLRVEVLAPCVLRLWTFRLASGALTAETLAIVQVEPGIFTLGIPLDQMQDAYSFVAEADDELLHFPVLVADPPS